ncbi:MAG: hypothetical protein FJ267_13755, partial [Planctomycetes bacterium]|nr:hypothetical protein [Planctomycetota bacterium]
MRCTVFGIICWSFIISTGVGDDSSSLKSLFPEVGKSKSSASPVRTLEPVYRQTALNSWVSSLAFNPDGTLLAIGLKDQIQILNLESRSMVREISTKSGQVRAIAFSPNGSLMATGSYQNLSIWEASTGTLIKTFKGHRAYVNGVSFSPDGNRIATACDDELVRIWAVEGSDTPVVFNGHRLPVTGVAWSADGRFIASSAG